jgi:LytR cell envelope-related transcriptional attenuator
VGSDLLPFSEVTSVIAAVSVIGIFLLLPLYLSQRRDVHRLREWMQANPGHPAEDLAVSERILDVAERDLARAYADRGEPVPGTMEFEAVRAATAVKEPTKGDTAALPLEESLLTSERPALAQVTMERSALEPHPKWKRFAGRATQPRWLAIIALVALGLGVGGIIIVDRVLRDDGDGGGVVVEPGGIEVAVLNTTTASGIAGRVAGDIEDSGFIRGQVGNIERDTDQTIVMYAPDQKRAAKRVARTLDDVAVQQMDREVQTAAGGADVVVILGQDRVAP